MPVNTSTTHSQPHTPASSHSTLKIDSYGSSSSHTHTRSHTPPRCSAIATARKGNRYILCCCCVWYGLLGMRWVRPFSLAFLSSGLHSAGRLLGDVCNELVSCGGGGSVVVCLPLVCCSVHSLYFSLKCMNALQHHAYH